MRYMPVNSGSVLHGIWHDLRLRELKDKLEEMYVLYELSHKKGTSMSNKKFVSFQDLTLSRNKLGLVVVSGLPTGDSTLIVVPPIGSVQTDKIGFNDLSIDERCALWALVYGQTFSERPTFKPASVLNHGGIPVKSPKPNKVSIKFLSTTAPADSPQLAELLSLTGMAQRNAEAEGTDTNDQEQGKAEMTTSHQATIARLDELTREVLQMSRDLDAFPDQVAPTEEASVPSEENINDIDADVLAAMRGMWIHHMHDGKCDSGTVVSVKKTDDGLEIEINQDAEVPAQDVSETKDPELMGKLVGQLIGTLLKADTPTKKLARRVNALVETMRALDASLAATYNRNQPTPTSEEAVKATIDKHFSRRVPKNVEITFEITGRK